MKTNPPLRPYRAASRPALPEEIPELEIRPRHPAVAVLLGILRWSFRLVMLVLLRRMKLFQAVKLGEAI